MNRIVLIGNGFDLAHGLPTSYTDFINYYWEKRIEYLRSCFSNEHSDGLSRFKCYNIHWPWVNSIPQTQGTSKEILEAIQKDKSHFQLTKTPLLDLICTSFETKSWVDIENEYYTLLKSIAKKEPCGYNSPLKLDEELLILKNYLVSYLRELEKSEIKEMNSIRRAIYEPLRSEDISFEWEHYLTQFLGNGPTSIRPEHIFLLNFNYTSTIQKYVNENSEIYVCHIHGKLSDPDKIIFGYGDELDSDYKMIRDLNDNDYLTNIKSIRYLETDNYRRLLAFIDFAPYQISIMGHSCGNSDRTLLNTIFEHKNCVSIKPYYHVKDDGRDNYIDIVKNISRDFNDMQLMRSRVVNKSYCRPLKQM